MLTKVAGYGKGQIDVKTANIVEYRWKCELMMAIVMGNKDLKPRGSKGPNDEKSGK